MPFLKSLNYTLFLSVCFSIYTLDAQNLTFEAPNGASPTASGLGNYAQFPSVSNTGMANLSVPLITLEGQDISLPMSLSYRSNGLKVEQEAGWTGMQWNLNAGGVITRSVRGIPDDRYYVTYPDPVEPNISIENYGWLVEAPFFDGPMCEAILNFPCNDSHYSPTNCLEPHGEGPESYNPEANYAWFFFRNTGGTGENIDTEPDLFFLNLSGMTATFIMGHDGLPKLLNTSNLDLDISYTSGIDNGDDNIQGFIVTDTKGYKYYFEQAEQTTIDTYNFQVYCNDDTGACSGSAPAEPRHTLTYNSSWFLTKIEYENTGETLDLTYELHTTQRTSLLDEGRTRCASGSEYSCEDVGYPAPSSGNLLTRKVITTTNTPFLDEIQTKYYQAIFDISPRLDLIGGKKLDRIAISTKENAAIRNFHFQYEQIKSSEQFDYREQFDFLGTAWNIDFDFDDMSMFEEASRSRLFLTSVQEIGANGETDIPPYQFSYHQPELLPTKHSTEQDHWGIYNNNNSKTLIPQLYVYPNAVENYNRFRIHPMSNSSSGATPEYYLEGANRDADITYAQLGNLKSLTYPLGGSITIDYALNSFHDSDAEQNLTGAGIRIASLIQDDANGNQTTHIYQYDLADGNSSGTLVRKPNYATELGYGGFNGENDEYGTPVNDNGGRWYIFNPAPNPYVNNIDPSWTEYELWDYFTWRQARSYNPLGDEDGMQISYTKIIDLIPGNGKTVHSYSSVANYKDNASLVKTSKAYGTSSATNLGSAGGGSISPAPNSILTYESYDAYVNGEVLQIEAISEGILADLGLNSSIPINVNFYPRCYDEEDVENLPNAPAQNFAKGFAKTEGTNIFPYPPLSKIATYNDGKLLSSVVYTESGDQVASTSYNYDEVLTKNAQGSVEISGFTYAHHNCTVGFSVNGANRPFAYARYVYEANIASFVSSKSESIDGETKTTSYEYADHGIHFEPLAISFNNADGIHRTEIDYAYEKGIVCLIDRGMPAVAIEQRNSVNGIQALGSKIDFGTFTASGSFAYTCDQTPSPTEGLMILPRNYYMWAGEWSREGTANSYNSDALITSYQHERKLHPDIFNWSNGLLMSKSFSDWTWNWTYHPRRLPKKATDFDGLNTRYNFDGYSRLKKTTGPFFRYTTDYDYAIGGGNNAMGEITTFSDGSPIQSTTSTFDGLGRPLSSAVNNVATTNYIYNEFGQPYSEQYLPGSTTLVDFEMSPLNRPIKKTWPDGNFIELNHNGLTLTTTNERGFVSSVSKDWLGRTVSTTDELDYTTAYDYHPNGKISAITPPVGPAYEYTYDDRHRLTNRSVPSAGEVDYCYSNRTDLLCNTTDANGNSISYQYDDYGRQTHVYLGGSINCESNEQCAPSGGVLLHQNTYDTGGLSGLSKGRITSTFDRLVGTANSDKGNTTSVFGFDEFGRVILESLNANVEGDNYTERYSYTLNDADWMESVSRLGNVIDMSQNFQHDNFGRVVFHASSPVEGASSYVSTTYNTIGQITQLDLGGLSKQKHVYNERGWLTSINRVTNEIVKSYDRCGEPIGDPELEYVYEEDLTIRELLNRILNGDEIDFDDYPPCPEDCKEEVIDYTLFLDKNITLTSQQEQFFLSGACQGSANGVVLTGPYLLTQISNGEGVIMDLPNFPYVVGGDVNQDTLLTNLMNLEEDIINWFAFSPDYFATQVVVTFINNTILIEIIGTNFHDIEAIVQFEVECLGKDGKPINTGFGNWNYLFTPSDEYEVDCPDDGGDGGICTVDVFNSTIRIPGFPDRTTVVKENCGDPAEYYVSFNLLSVEAITTETGELLPLPNYPYEFHGFSGYGNQHPTSVLLENDIFALLSQYGIPFDSVSVLFNQRTNDVDIALFASTIQLRVATSSNYFECKVKGGKPDQKPTNTGTYVRTNNFFNYFVRPINCPSLNPDGDISPTEQLVLINDVKNIIQTRQLANIPLPNTLYEAYFPNGEKVWALKEELLIVKGGYTIYRQFPVKTSNQLFDLTKADSNRYIANLSGLLDQRRTGIINDIIPIRPDDPITDPPTNGDGPTIDPDTDDPEDCLGEPPICTEEEQEDQLASLAIINNLTQQILDNPNDHPLPDTLVMIQLCDGTVTYVLASLLDELEGNYTILNEIPFDSWGDLFSVNGQRKRDLFAMRFNHQENGNIETMRWKVTHHMPKEYQLEYDPKDQLLLGNYFESITTASNGALSTQLLQTDRYKVDNISYDPVGNILSIRRMGMIAGENPCLKMSEIDNLTMNYESGSIQLNSVADTPTDIHHEYGFPASLGAGDPPSYSYDGNGNMTTDPYKGIGIDYNFLNLPAQADGTAYIYDASGNKWRTTGPGGIRTYVRGVEIVDQEIESISINSNVRIAMAGDEARTEYRHTDHLGNVRVSFSDLNNDGKIAITEVGEITQENHYYPFGMNQVGYWYSTAAPEDRYRFNSNELDEAMGMYDYGARYYDPVIARWGQIDPLASNFPNWSSYSYVYNNPARFIDPDGMAADDIVYYNSKGEEVNRIVTDELHLTYVDLNDDGNYSLAPMPNIIEGFEDSKYQRYDHLIAAHTHIFNNLGGSERPTTDNGLHLDGNQPTSLSPTLVKSIILQETKIGTYNGRFGANGSGDIMQANVSLKNRQGKIVDSDWNDSKSAYGLTYGGSAEPGQSVFAGIRILYSKGLVVSSASYENGVLSENSQVSWRGGSLNSWWYATRNYNGKNSYAIQVYKYWNNSFFSTDSKYYPRSK